MTWRTLERDDWVNEKNAAVAAATDDRIGQPILAFDTTMFGATTFAIHDGPLTIEGDFVPPADNVLIKGDLTVSGKIATEDEEQGRFGATLIVLGSVQCNAVFNGEGCLFLVSGHIVACSWFFGPIMDASVLAGGDFVTPIFFGSDIWVTVGGATAFDHGDGMSLPLDTFFTGNASGRAIRASRPVAETVALLDLDPSVTEWDFNVLSALEERLHDIGTILPDHGDLSLPLPAATPDRAERVAQCERLGRVG